MQERARTACLEAAPTAAVRLSRLPSAFQGTAGACAWRDAGAASEVASWQCRQLTLKTTCVSSPMVSRGSALACRTNDSMSMTRRSAESRQIAPSRASRTAGSTSSPNAGTAAARRPCSKAAQGCRRRQAVAPNTVSKRPAAGAGSPAGATAAADAASAAGAAAAGTTSPAAAGSLTVVNCDSTLRRDSKFLRCPSRAPAGKQWARMGGWSQGQGHSCILVSLAGVDQCGDRSCSTGQLLHPAHPYRSSP